MDWISRFNDALEFLEDNLTEKITIDEIAQKANSSSFHFQRMFSMVVDIPLSEYIRRRKLSLAASEIQRGADILSTAIKYGYESQSSFTRSFVRLFEITPKQSKQLGCKLKAYPPISFLLSIKGGQRMEYEIRTVDEISIVGIVKSFTRIESQHHKEIPKFWNEVVTSSQLNVLLEKTNPDGILRGGFLGIPFGLTNNGMDFKYLIGIEPKDSKNCVGFDNHIIPKQTWAIFPGNDRSPGTEYSSIWKRIFTEWFPATNYEYRNAPEMEIYYFSADSKQVDHYEIWIPIIEK